MEKTALMCLDNDSERVSTEPSPFLISIPDSERLSLQSRFVRNQLEAEILNDLDACIGNATLLDPAAVPPDLVTMNSRVVLREVESGREWTVTLAFPASAKNVKGRLSVLTPLGSNLLGARTGQALTGSILGTISTVVVEAILHQPESVGDFYG